jgi:chemotaxis protein methyltransferase CheR
VCRNVLIYFSPATAAAVLERLVEALRPGGWLLVGPVEVPLAGDLDLEREDVPGATLLQRGAGPARRSPVVRAVVQAHGASAALARTPAPATVSTPTPAREPAPVAAPTGVVSAEQVAVGPEDFEAARAAARAGDLEAAERIARETAERRLCPESYLLLAMAAEDRGDATAALEAVRRALYLEPSLAQAHAALVPLYGRLGRAAEAARARRNALEALRGLEDDTVLRGVEPITAGALRLALTADGGASQPAATAAGRNP